MKNSVASLGTKAAYRYMTGREKLCVDLQLAIINASIIT